MVLLGLPAWLKPDVALTLARFYLDQGDPGTAQAALKPLGMSLQEGPVLSDPVSLPDPLTHQVGLESLILLRLRLNRARAGQALQERQLGIDLADSLVSRALAVRRLGIALQALLLRAQIVALLGDTEASLADLRKAIELAEPEGYVRSFLDEGPAIVTLLRLLLTHPDQPGDRQASFVRHLLASYNANGPFFGSGDVRIEETLVEPLTDREMDVMRLIAEGLKYQEIAGRLFISLNTVRFYVKEIYSKLNVNNRTQAIEAAHKHHLL
jgi:LuxR family maltose regulon positive regulatory protein